MNLAATLPDGILPEVKYLNDKEADCNGFHFEDRKGDGTWSAYRGDIRVWVQMIGNSWGFTAWERGNCFHGVCNYNWPRDTAIQLAALALQS